MTIFQVERAFCIEFKKAATVKKGLSWDSNGSTGYWPIQNETCHTYWSWFAVNRVKIALISG